MICIMCKKDADFLITNACEECDPELHKAYKLATKEYRDGVRFEDAVHNRVYSQILHDRKVNFSERRRLTVK